MRKLHNKVGPPVEGADFFGRDKEIAQAWADILDKNHLSIIAPRRVGKSSLVKGLIQKARDNGWKAAYIDVQEVTDEIGFLKVFVDTLKSENESWFSKAKENALTSLNKIFSNIEVELKTEAGSAKFKWTGTHSAEISAKIKELLSGTDDFLIAIDELPFFLSRIAKDDEKKERISDFLHWLRAQRQKAGSNIRWIFCGSIGLDSFAERHNLSEAFNDLLTFDIGPFDTETAKGFLRKLGNDNDLPLTDINIDCILKKMGWPLPYFLQAHFKQLNRLKTGTDKVVSEKDIETAYKKIIQQAIALRTWEERLDVQLDIEDASLCKLLLTRVSKTPGGTSRKKLQAAFYTQINDAQKCEEKLNFCLKILSRDGYILLGDKNYAFRSPLLRDFWYELKVR